MTSNSNPLKGAHSAERESGFYIPIDLGPEMFRQRVPRITMKSKMYNSELIAEQRRLRQVCQSHLDAELTQDILGSLADKYLNSEE